MSDWLTPLECQIGPQVGSSYCGIDLFVATATRKELTCAPQDLALRQLTSSASEISINDQKNGTPLTPTRWPNLRAVQGSYYHKVISPYGHFIGISAQVKLGSPEEDPKRFEGKLKKPEDGFSTYLGGNVYGKHEVDAGMTWSVTRDQRGKVDYQHKAWRPFWRDGKWGNAPCKSIYYWKPGDMVNMTLTEAGNGLLKLTVADVGLHPKRYYSKTFAAKGFDKDLLASFKRVESIDQVHREGKAVLPTRASLRGVQWIATDLLMQSAGGQIVKVPLDPAHRKIIEPLPGHIAARASDAEKTKGGERVDIFGSRPAPGQK